MWHNVTPHEGEETMSAQEYVRKKSEQTIENIYANAVAKAKADEMEKYKKEDYERTFSGFISKLADDEAEVSILEGLVSDAISKGSDASLSSLKGDLANAKRRYTKTKNEMEAWLSGYEKANG